ncbi:Nucleotidyl transferase AbiEii toxin, Type IV TA system [Actinopolymorpha cephalotaxi]|uniref:Nucleotidyl transferase AbiEii toxin, Type IV TA system n=1 Tax=Actinopolymorpha cephalotaxi TaxID=504797 RepID=A0A1I2M903_9ACTN|nr:nucleotidyl transferase AbiEii/AbiGii toxin family protein [Actinopolymorpha cephalotaxi]NYH81642.1 hypothetical protein [Actinopolymorpha cephalotaxi]SFF87953.1 Nucleotidyl transferase AbiEii toxin, Type IV TA system [Actinopolymorpha cephalotaxi]
MTAVRRPTRATVEGRAYLDLQNLARRQHRPTDELHQLYALEGFLSRLAISRHADKLVLKGGVLLAAYDARRPTRDVDMQARAISGEREDVLRLVRDIAAARVDDGLRFDTDASTAEVIRDDDEYSGVRITLTATLASAKLSLHVDINIGDPIWPTTALQRGIVNTRRRDFADLYLLSGRHSVKGAELQGSLAEVAAYRRVELLPLTDVLDGYASSAQARWFAWRRKQSLEERLPSSFMELLGTVIAFADPALTGTIAHHQWDPGTRRWS